MEIRTLTLEILPGSYAVCRLAPDAEVPAWASGPARFCSITRTPLELSIVCADPAVPPGTRTERGLRLLQVQGNLDFSLTGILASIAVPLAQAEVSIFALSTYDTDYLLVAEANLAKARAALAAAGHTVRG